MDESRKKLCKTGCDKMQTIKLSIQEIVNDFEKITREDERMGMLASYELIETDDYNNFYKVMKELCKKYIPNYQNLVPSSYKNQNKTEQGITLYNILCKNFKEIIFQLI